MGTAFKCCGFWVFKRLLWLGDGIQSNYWPIIIHACLRFPPPPPQPPQTIPEIVASKACTRSPYTFWSGELTVWDWVWVEFYYGTVFGDEFNTTRNKYKKRWRPENDHVTLVLHTLTLCNVRKTTPTKAHVQRRKMNSLRKQPSFRRNSVVMTCYHLDLGSASDIMKQIFRSTTQVWVVCVIWMETISDVPKYGLFSQAK